MAKKIYKIVLSLILTLTLFTGSLSWVDVGALTQTEIQNQLQKYEEEKAALNKKLQSLKADKASQQAYQNTLSQKISLINTQINNLHSQINGLNSQISSMEAEIAAKEKEIEESWDLFKARLRAIYMTNDTSYLASVLGSESWSDMLMKSETIKRVSEHDKKLILSLEEAIKKIESDIAEIEESKKSIEEMKASVSSQLKELDEAYKESQLAINHLKNQETAANKDIEKIKAEQEALRRELDAIVNGNTSSGTVSSGSWTWPCPSSRYITSYFQAIDAIRDYNAHTGIDIAAATGTPIVAANYGTVIAVVTNYTPGVGYGIYTMIDHGSNIYTLYAHCSRIAVSVGQRVVPGQVVAYVGNTGNSSGPHLHFGVSIKKSGVNYWQNPLNYVHR